MSKVKKNKIERILEASHLSSTDQRLAILKYLQGNVNHPTANEIFEALHPEYPSITLTNVKEHLHIFVAKQLIRKIAITPNMIRYDGNLQSHYHVICTHCNSVKDFNYPGLFDIESIASQITKHQIYMHELMLFGVCEKCSSSEY